MRHHLLHDLALAGVPLDLPWGVGQVPHGVSVVLDGLAPLPFALPVTEEIHGQSIPSRSQVTQLEAPLFARGTLSTAFLNYGDVLCPSTLSFPSPPGTLWVRRGLG